MGSRKLRKALVALTLATACSLLASASHADVVVLKDGTKIEGTVKSQEPGKWVIIELANGSQKTIIWDDLKEIEVKVVPPSPPPAATTEPPKEPKKKKKKKAAVEEAPTDDDEEAEAPKPKKKKKKKKGETTGYDAKVGNDGTFSAGAKHQCAEDDAACREEIKVEGKGTDVKGSYTSEEDCSDEDDENCTATTKASGGADGIGLSYTKESVKKVKQPPSGAAMFGFSSNVLMGFGDNLTMVGGNIGFSLRILTGSKFPGMTGGNWSGLFLEPSALVSFVTIKTETDPIYVGGRSYGGDSSSTSSGLFQTQLSAGFQFMHFGKADPKTLKQGGFGFALGGSVGVVKSFEGGDASLNYGPVLSLIFPKYNAGTASVSSTQINIFVLPSKAFTLLLLGAQFSF